MTKTRIVTCQYKEIENDLDSFLYGCGALGRVDGETLEDLNKRSERMCFEIGKRILLSSTDGRVVNGTEALFSEGIVHDSEITALLMMALMKCVQLADKELTKLKISKDAIGTPLEAMMESHEFIATDADLEEVTEFLASREK